MERAHTRKRKWASGLLASRARKIRRFSFQYGRETAIARNCLGPQRWNWRRGFAALSEMC